jgi:hypothetical protein
VITDGGIFCYMIIWLSSYPRSGNTLLRTVLHRCFGLYSYADEPVDYQSEFRDNPEMIGHIKSAEPWETLYSKFSKFEDAVLVKTHLPPRDNQPFIYVVRDGRSAIQSYWKFHRDFNCREVPLASLILGDDAYGHWSDHYRAWNGRYAGKKIVLHYHDLIHASGTILEKIADFLEHPGGIRPWINPIDELHHHEPDFFNQANEVFTPGANWSPFHQHLFDFIHGDLMRELGYCTVKKGAGSAELSGKEGFDLFSEDVMAMTHKLLQEKRTLQTVCDERLELINRLQSVCDERLELINRLHNAHHPSSGGNNDR